MSESHPQNRSIISVVVGPSFIEDWENLQRALDLLSQQDQGMRITTEPTEQRVIISGMGWLHLEVISDRLIREFKIPLDVGKPEVIYRETIRRYSEAEARYIRQVGGRGQYAHVKLGLSRDSRKVVTSLSTRVQTMPFRDNSWNPLTPVFRKP
jgi:elongation factor G